MYLRPHSLMSSPHFPATGSLLLVAPTDLRRYEDSEVDGEEDEEEDEEVGEGEAGEDDEEAPAGRSNVAAINSNRD